MIKKQLAKAKVRTASTSTHTGNDVAKLDVVDAEQELRNNMSVDTLVDPEDFTGGSTHTAVTAAAEDEDEDEGVMIEGPEDEEEDEEVDASFDMEDEVGDVAELTNNNAPSTLTATDGEGDDWDAAPAADDGEDFVDDLEDSSTDEVDDEFAEDGEDEPAADGESLDLLDVDEVPDTDTTVAFASMGTRLLVIKANRIIASMTKQTAVAASRDDVYMGDQFQEVTASEIKKAGLRRGLKAMGFTLAKVNVSKSAVVNAKVQKEVTRTTAAVRKVAAAKEEAFNQSLTIAAVGINRRYFDQPNELKAHLESELQRAGVRGGAKMLQRAFAAFGPSYAKSIVELATKISAMPKESREGFVAALDLTTTDLDDVSDEEILPGDDVGDEGDEFENDLEATAGTVTASLASPGRRYQPQVAGTVSVTASAILNGEQPLFM